MLGSDWEQNLVELMREVSAIWKYDFKCAGARTKTNKTYPKFRFWSKRYVFIYYFMCTAQTLSVGTSDLRWRPDKNNNNFVFWDGFISLRQYFYDDHHHRCFDSHRNKFISFNQFKIEIYPIKIWIVQRKWMFKWELKNIKKQIFRVHL